MEFHPIVFFLQFATFLAGLWIASKVFLPYLRGWMEERERRIAERLETSRRNAEESEKLRAELDRKLLEAETRARELLQGARREAEKLKEETVAEARKEAERVLSDARLRLDQERRGALEELRRTAGEMAVSIAERLVRGSIDPAVQQRILRESLKDLAEKR